MPISRRAVLGATLTTALAGCAGTDGSEATPADGGGEPPTERSKDTTTGAPTAGEDTATPTPGTDGTPTGQAGTPTPDATGTGDGPTVLVGSHPDLGDVLTDGAGRTLYMFDRDTRGAGTSACSGGCASTWPPLTAPGGPRAGDGVTATLSTFPRDGGDRQVAAAGWPLYYFAADEDPGDAGGQAVNDVWWVLGPDGTPRRDADGGGAY